MNPLLSRLQPYPFERLRALTQDVRPNPDFTPISLGIGEPKHPTPEFLKVALTASLDGLAAYPATAGLPAMRQACASWVQRRYGVTLDAATQILPVNGSRGAPFSRGAPRRYAAGGGPAPRGGPPPRPRPATPTRAARWWSARIRSTRSMKARPS